MFLLLGLLTASQAVFWQRIAQSQRWLGMLCLGNAGLLLGSYYLSGQDVLVSFWQTTFQYILLVSYSLQSVAMTFWLLAWAQQHLNQPYRYLSLANRAIFPVYLVHQSLIIIAAMFLAPFHLGGGIEALLVILLTLSGCGLMLIVIWRLPLLAPFFGMKTNRLYSPLWQKIGWWLGFLLVTPLAFELLT